MGADGYHALANQVAPLAKRLGLTETQVDHLLGRYGSLIFEVLEPAESDPQLLQPVPGAEGYIMAEVRYAVTHEGAVHLEDILHRRLRISMEYADRGVEAAEAIATLVAPFLDWDAARIGQELKVYRDRTAAALEAEKQLTDSDANAVATAVVDTRPDIDTSQDR